jgi:hypothetical protein
LFVIHQVAWDGGAARRDLWFAIDKADASTSIVIYAYKTFTEARTNSGSGYVASVTIDTADLGDDETAITTHALVDNAAVAPTIAATLSAYGSAVSAGVVSGIYCLTAAPDLYVCDVLVELLGDYTTTGLVLEDFASTVTESHFGVGDPGEARAMPYVAVRTTDWELIGDISTGSIRAGSWAIDLDVLTVRMDTGDEAGPRENSWRFCRAYQGAIESILLDEKRRLGGAIFTLTSLDGKAPEPEADSLLYKATITVGAEFLNVWPEQDD